MNASEIVENLKGKKGQHVAATWQRPAKTYKNCPHVIAKRTSVFVRSGIDFANLATVKNGIESGERGEVQPLPWGKWKQFPYVIEHNGVEYVRLYPAAFENLKPSVEWSINGKPAKFEDVEPFLLASELKEKNECFVVKAENVIDIAEK